MTLLLMAATLRQMTELMAAAPASDAGKTAKGALFVRLVEVLPQALHRRREGGGSLAAVTDVLAAIRKLVVGRQKAHQALFRWATRALCRTQGWQAAVW